MATSSAAVPTAAVPATTAPTAFGDTSHLGEFDLAVIGAGPAGMAASATAAEHGLRVALIDAGRQLGGQYFRHPAPGLTADWLPKLYHGWQQFEHLVTRVETAANLQVLFGHQVWAIEPGFKVLTDRGPIQSRYVILATGAYERVIPFPGWDLPGVFTAGGAQALLKGNLVLPGRRVVVAGTGPLLLPVAAGLAAAGAKVLGLYEANTIRGYAKNPLPLLTNPTKLAEGLDYARQFTRARIPIHTGRMITEAQGTTTLEAVVTTRPDGTDPQRIPCDTLAIGYGLAPQIDLALTLGAAPAHLADGTVALRVNTTQRTTIPGLYAAGETAGVAGAETALLEGEIAGLAVAQAAARARRVASRGTGVSRGEEPSATVDADSTAADSAAASDDSRPAPGNDKATSPVPVVARALAAARARISRRADDADTSAGGEGRRASSPGSDTPAATSDSTGRSRFSRRASSPGSDTSAATSDSTGRSRFSRRASSPGSDTSAATSDSTGRSRFTRRTSSPDSDTPAATSASTSRSRRVPPGPDTPADTSEPAGRIAAARALLTRRTAASEPLASEPPATEAAPNTPPSLPTLLRRRTRQRALADLLRARHPIPAAWRDHLAADTIVCRCEEVPAAAITEAVGELGAGDARTVKLLTRAGMGWCQGRVCGYAVACLARGADEPPSDADLLAAASRPLARPVPLGVLAEQDRRNK